MDRPIEANVEPSQARHSHLRGCRCRLAPERRCVGVAQRRHSSACFGEKNQSDIVSSRINQGGQTLSYVSPLLALGSSAPGRRLQPKRGPRPPARCQSQREPAGTSIRRAQKKTGPPPKSPVFTMDRGWFRVSVWAGNHRLGHASHKGVDVAHA